MTASEYTKWTSGIAVLAGLWAVAAPFVWSVAGPLLWSNVLTGAVIAAFAGFTAYRAREGESVHRAIPAVAVLAGGWAIAAPFALASPGQAFLVSNVVTGLAVAVLAGFTLVGGERDLSSVTRPTA